MYFETNQSVRPTFVIETLAKRVLLSADVSCGFGELPVEEEIAVDVELGDPSEVIICEIMPLEEGSEEEGEWLPFDGWGEPEVEILVIDESGEGVDPELGDPLPDSAANEVEILVIDESGEGVDPELGDPIPQAGEYEVEILVIDETGAPPAEEAAAVPPPAVAPAEVAESDDESIADLVLDLAGEELV